MVSMFSPVRLSLLLVLLMACLLPSAPAQTFTKAYKDPVWHTQFAAVERMGNAYYACGYVSSPSDGIYYGDVSKIDLNGNLLWTVRPFGETVCRFFDLEPTESGDFIVVGRTEPLSNAQGQPINNRSVVCRVSSAGAVVWARSFDFSPLGREGFWSIKRDADAVGTFFLTGHTNGPNGAGPTDWVLLAEMTDAGSFVKVSELLSTVVPAGQTDNEFFLKVDQPAGPTSVMWLCGLRRTVNFTTTYGLITGVEESTHAPVLATLLDAGTTVKDILPEATTPVMRMLGVGQKNGEAIFFAYYPQATSGFIWSVKVSGQTEFLKLVKADAPNHYFVLGRATLDGQTKYLINYFDASGSSPVLLWTRVFDQGETSFSDPGILASGADRVLYFDTRLDNPGGVGKEVFLSNFDPAQGNCLAQELNYTATDIALERTVPNIVRMETEIPAPNEIPSTTAAYGQRTLCSQGCSEECLTNSIELNSGKNMYYGQFDATWMLVQSPYTSLPLPRPANVVNFCWPCGWGYQNDSYWISAHPGHDFWDNNAFPSNAYVFENRFCTCADNSSITIDLSVLADDEAVFELYDGNGNFIQALLTATSFSTPTTANVTILLPQAGTYVIRASMRNLAHVALGMSIVGTVSGENLVRPECCRPENLIYGVKYSDQNGNAFRNYDLNASPSIYEPGIPNWEIQLCDAGGTPIQTAFTDAQGYYEFKNVLPGVYILKEVNQPGWMQTEPTSGTYNITVEAGGVVANRNFGNHQTSATQSPNSAQQVNLYPNPVSDYLLIELEAVPTTCTVQIVDLLGHVLRTKTLPKGNTTCQFDTTDLPAGAYLIQFKQDGLGVWTQQFIKL